MSILQRIRGTVSGSARKVLTTVKALGQSAYATAAQSTRRALLKAKALLKKHRNHARTIERVSADLAAVITIVLFLVLILS